MTTARMMAKMTKRSLALLCLVALCFGQKKRKQEILEWDPKVNVQKTYTRGCANLTHVLDNWKFAIMTQVKGLLLNDHSVVLPDYGRIQPLSDALGDVYKQFDALKEQLVQLTSRFDGVESFTDQIQEGRFRPPPQRVEHPPPPQRAGHLSTLPQKGSPAPHTAEGSRHRTRILGRKIQRPQV